MSLVATTVFVLAPANVFVLARMPANLAMFVLVPVPVVAKVMEANEADQAAEAEISPKEKLFIKGSLRVK